jgi:Family of unknown function (DUF6527)
MKTTVMTHEFVEAIGEDLEEGKLYVSIRYRTAAHLCPCGCRSKVVTPIRPARWHLKYDGSAVSLWPSIGNWQKPCRSHYWIRNDRIEWARPWSDDEIAEGRTRDAAELQEYYGEREQVTERQRQGEIHTHSRGGNRIRQMLKRLWPF